MPENPYRGCGASMLGFRGYEEKAYDRGFAAGAAAATARAVEELRALAARHHGSSLASYAIREAADLIERTAKNPEHE